METIDITTIATIRPAILQKTLESLKRHLCHSGDYRLIIDVAPVGEADRTREEVVDVAKKIFPNITVRMLESSPQSEAQKWAWATANSPFFLQWEDDWELLQPICLKEVLAVFDRYPMTAMVFFDREGKSVIDYVGYKSMFEQVEPNLYRRIKHLNFGGPPAVINREFIKWTWPMMKDDECLDVTCENPKVRESLAAWDFFVITNSDGGFVRDLGKDWMKANGFSRKKRTKVGMKWIKMK